MKDVILLEGKGCKYISSRFVKYHGIPPFFVSKKPNEASWFSRKTVIKIANNKLKINLTTLFLVSRQAITKIEM